MVTNSRNPKDGSANFSLLYFVKWMINQGQCWKKRGEEEPGRRKKTDTFTPQREEEGWCILHNLSLICTFLLLYFLVFHIHVPNPLLSQNAHHQPSPSISTFPLILQRVKEASLTSQPAWQQPINYDWQVCGPIKAPPYFMHSKSDFRLLRRVAADMFIVIMVGVGMGVMGAPQH